MIKAKKVLFITQEISPYVDESVYTPLGRYLPQATQEVGKEIRTFSPKWGKINERRNMLHEVIRLSGMNIIIDDTDHPLIIKVASIQAARLQVYFIDNDDYFNKRLAFADEKGQEYEDNAERAIFYARGVLETVKKLRWVPEVIHCQGWIGAVLPIYIKKAYADEPCFRDVKVVYSPIDVPLEKPLPENFGEILAFRDVTADDMADYEGNDIKNLIRLAIKHADGVTFTKDSDPELVKYAEEAGVETLIAEDDEKNKIIDFYDQIWGRDKEEEEEDDDF